MCRIFRCLSHWLTSICSISRYTGDTRLMDRCHKRRAPAWQRINTIERRCLSIRFICVWVTQTKGFFGERLIVPYRRQHPRFCCLNAAGAEWWLWSGFQCLSPAPWFVFFDYISKDPLFWMASWLWETHAQAAPHSTEGEGNRKKEKNDHATGTTSHIRLILLNSCLVSVGKFHLTHIPYLLIKNISP